MRATSANGTTGGRGLLRRRLALPPVANRLRLLSKPALFAAVGMALLEARVIVFSRGGGLRTALPIFFPVAIWIGLNIVRRPILGLGLFALLLPLQEVLPSLPGAASWFRVTGGIALLAYILHRGAERDERGGPLSISHLSAFLFIAWFSTVNLAAAVDNPARNWLITYVALWFLMWLTSRLLDRPEHFQLVMWAYSIGAAFSGLVAMGQVAITTTFEHSIRGGGTQGGPNAAARAFVLSFVFFAYLQRAAGRRRERLLALGGAVISLGGVAATLSRSGLILAAIAVVLVLRDNVRREHRRRLVIALAVLGVAALVVPRSYWTVVVPTVDPTASSSTLGLRLDLWGAGLHMWSDHPVAGVGIGQFQSELPNYANSNFGRVKTTDGPHNVYVGLLAETGLVGFLLFALVAWGALSRLWWASTTLPQETRDLARYWMFALVLMLLGGLTKHDQYDKILWVLFGGGLAFSADAFRAVAPRRKVVQQELARR